MSFITVLLFVLSLITSNEWENKFKLHTEAIAINPLNERTILVASNHRIYRSEDGGNNFVFVNGIEQGASIRQIKIPSADTNIIIVSCGGQQIYTGLHISRDRGQTFAHSIEGYSNGKTCYDFGSTLLYATLLPPCVFKSTNLGIAWDTLINTIPFDTSIKKLCSFFPSADTGNSFLLFGLEPSKILRYSKTGGWDIVYSNKIVESDELPQIIKSLSDTLYAIRSVGVSIPSKSFLKSGNGGRTWMEFSAPFSLWAVDYETLMPGHIFIGKFTGYDPEYKESAIYHSVDDGYTWMALGKLKDDKIWDLKYAPSSRYLYACGITGLNRIYIP
jgi:hypothetical protein